MNDFYVEYFSPVTRQSGIVVTTQNGVTRGEADIIAAESNRKYKPLQYLVKEFALKGGAK